MEKAIAVITKMLFQPGLYVNNSKTKPFLFYKQDISPTSLIIGDDVVWSSKTLNLMDVLFDTKLNGSLLNSNA
jgi:hypothetical protein